MKVLLITTFMILVGCNEDTRSVKNKNIVQEAEKKVLKAKQEQKRVRLNIIDKMFKDKEMNRLYKEFVSDPDRSFVFDDYFLAGNRLKEVKKAYKNGEVRRSAIEKATHRHAKAKNSFIKEWDLFMASKNDR